MEDVSKIAAYLFCAEAFSERLAAIMAEREKKLKEIKSLVGALQTKDADKALLNAENALLELHSRMRSRLADLGESSSWPPDQEGDTLEFGLCSWKSDPPRHMFQSSLELPSIVSHHRWQENEGKSDLNDDVGKRLLNSFSFHPNRDSEWVHESSLEPITSAQKYL